MPIICKLLDVAEGLAYLHAKHVIHGDMKGVSISSGSCSTVLRSFYQFNILISGRGHARLTDFGLSSVVRGFNSDPVSELQGFTPRWAAPEIVMGNDCTQEADIYAFGMVVIEVSSLPFLCPASGVEGVSAFLISNPA